MGSRAAVGVALVMAVTGGCLLTSNFDGIADGTSDASTSSSGFEGETSSSSSSADANAFAYAQWSALGCAGRQICLGFDEADGGVEPAGWTSTTTVPGTLSRGTSASVSAPYALVANLAGSDGEGEGEAYLARPFASASGAPLTRLVWGFDATLSGCTGRLGTITQGSITLGGVSPVAGVAAGLVLGADADYLSLVSPTESQLTPLPARLPRDARSHVELQLFISGTRTGTLLTLLVNEAPVAQLDGPVLANITTPVLNVGAIATYPSSACQVVIDDYYFDGT